MVKHALALVVLVSMMASGVHAASKDLEWAVLRWTTEDGLPQNTVKALAQTPDGYLWIGTLMGLARFDGVRFTSFTRANTPDLATDTINALAADADGTLWIGTPEGLVEWRGGIARRWTAEDGLPGADKQNIQQISVRARGGMWFREGRHACRLTDGRITCFGIEHGLATNEVRSIEPARNGDLLVLTELGVQRLDAGRERFGELIRWPVAGVDWKVVEDSAGTLWAGCDSGCYRFDGWGQPGNAGEAARSDSWISCADAEGLRGKRVVQLFEDRSGNLWVATGESGLQQRRDGRFTGVSIGVSIGVETEQTGVSRMLEDREGNLWVGTGGDGLFCLCPQRIRSWTVRDGLPHNEVKSVSAGPDGSVWAATGRGLARIHAGRVETFREPWPEYGASRAFADREGNVWLAKHGIGVARWDGRTFITVRDPGLPSNFVNVFYQDRAGRVWLAEEGVTVFQEGQFERRFDKSEMNGAVMAMLEDHRGNLWFGVKGGGLKRFDGVRWTTFTTNDGLCDDRPMALYEDGDGVLWIGSEVGLTRHKDGKFVQIRTSQGLAENVVNQIIEDDFGNLWLSGQRGVSRVRRAELDAVAERRIARVMCVLFGEADGMANAETNGELQPAGAKTPDGRIWFPTGRGVVEIDPRALQPSEVLPPVVIEQVTADERVIFSNERAGPGAENRFEPSTSNFEISPGHARALRIEYTANSFARAKRVRFRYRLVGRDHDWREETSERAAYYTNLRPGQYRFEVKAANYHGAWNDVPATFSFRLAPHFWQTWWFSLLCAFAAIGLASGVQAYRLHVQRRILQLEQARALQQERTRIADDLHDDLGANLTGLALKAEVARRQLTISETAEPHFESVAITARSLVDSIREIIWLVSPRHDSLESLATFLAGLAEKAAGSNGLRFRLDLPAKFPKRIVPSTTRHHICLAVKEALHNVAKHAAAKVLQFHFTVQDETASIVVADDGKGFDTGNTRGYGNGMSTMRHRVEERLGGRLIITSTRDAGTRIEMRLPTSALENQSNP